MTPTHRSARRSTTFLSPTRNSNAVFCASGSSRGWTEHGGRDDTSDGHAQSSAPRFGFRWRDLAPAL